ncbi:MAG: alpha/beta hydrolase [Thiobacillus sp.]|nr:alpha/beta hydrolase [Thiobacillus sp.]
MHALFVHGMGRTPLSGRHMLACLRAEKIVTHTAAYAATFERFDAIRDRLALRIAHVAAQGDYVLIGHSLGGVLIRAALATLSPDTRRPSRVFLLGSPVRHSSFAYRLRRNWVFRVLAGDCGQLLASSERMTAIGRLEVPTTSIVGTTGWKGGLNPFQGDLNDGIVSLTETHADWIDEEVRVPAVHTYLPSNRTVTALIIERIAHAQDNANSRSIAACLRDP